jgi:hypothetical protein
LILKCLLLFSISSLAFAAPQTLEVWFLSNAKTSHLEQLLNRPAIKYRALTAQLECQEMGDFCFDPQYGLYKKEDSSLTLDASKVEKQGPTIPTAKSLDQDMISCDASNYFDIFCGKARAEAGREAKLDLWIDTSSSMREFDFSDKQGGCFRKSLVKRLDESCGFNQKVNVMMFDTSIKQAGSMESLCQNQGLNDYKRLIDWIERSTAKKLVVITDIYEFHKEFADYVESKNGKFRGDKEVLTAEGMLKLLEPLAKSCQ